MTRTSPPEVAAPLPPRFPLPEHDRLDNGMALRILHLPGQQVISAAVVIDAPLTGEDPEGIGTIIARTLDEGTATDPGTRYAERLELLGAGFGAHQDLGGVVAGIDVPASRLADALGLLADALAEPALADADLARQVALRLAEIEQQQANPAATAAREFRRTVFAPGYRGARPVGGEPDTVAAITPDAARARHARSYAPDRATLVIGGDLGGADVRALAERAFGGWSGSAEAASPPVAAAGAPAYRLIDRPGAVQANVSIGGFGIDRSDPRWPALRVALHAMGGSFGSRLNLLLREELGYTYGVRLAPAPLRTGGTFALSGSFRSEVTGDAITRGLGLMIDEVAPITTAEVTDAVNYYVGAAPLQWATAEALVDQHVRQVLDGLPDDHLTRQLEALGSVTAEQATAAYREIVTPESLSAVVVGAADDLDLPEHAALPPLTRG